MSIRQRRPRRRAASPANPVQERVNRRSDRKRSVSALRKRLHALFSRYRTLPGWTPNPVTAVMALLAVRTAGALWNGIADCDETYNYWEPLHYLVYGYGFQTWEYSPEFALRSYGFLLPYSAVAKLGNWIGGKIAAFYSVRLSQGVLSALAEGYLYDGVVWRFGKTPGKMLLVFLLTSPGIFRAATELLPSSFGMIAITAALGAWMVGEFWLGVFLVALASLLGWPYIALLGLPMALHVICRCGLLSFLRYSITSASIIAAFMLPVDWYYFGYPVITPLKAVIYNVFPKEGSGPDVFGVEDWTFYAVNLFLNMNVAFVLSLIAYPVLWTIDAFVIPVWKTGKDRMCRLIFLSPWFTWLLVFMLQPHKEERFLAPVYPLIALCGAVTFHDWLTLLFDPKSSALTNGRGPNRVSPPMLSISFRGVLKFLLFIALAVFSGALGCSRTFALLHGYNAPMKIYDKFGREELRKGAGPRSAPMELSSGPADINVCVGKEWYRFPSHFFLPSRRFRVRFIRQGFKGLLPKYYSEQPFGTRAQTRGMNMFNKEDPDQYFANSSMCHYFVDLDLSHRLGFSRRDENPIPPESRLILYREKFLDAEVSPPGYRAFFIPGETERLVKYGEYQITRNMGLLPSTSQN